MGMKGLGRHALKVAMDIDNHGAERAKRGRG